MLDHVTIRVSNLEKSKQFYEKAFAPLNYPVAFGQDGVFWAFAIGRGCLFEIMQHTEKKPITSCHIAFRAKTPKQVNEFFQSAVLAGALDNGQPGPRPQYTEHYYACFIFDPDGHNIEVMHDHWQQSKQ